MWRYIVRRLLWVVVVVLVVTAITYVVFFVMPSSDPAVTFAGKNPTPEQIEEVRRQFGLDKPVPVQYVTFLKHVFLGDQYGWPGLGFSYSTRSPVKDQFFDRVLVTAQLAIGAALVWLAIGIPIGIVSAIKRRTLTDRLAMGFALFFVSAPVFWLGLMGLWLFWFKLRWSPGTGYVAWNDSFGGWLSHMILPWVVLALLYAASYARMTRGNLLETMGQDYIRTARVKGLSERTVVLKHGLRASLTPVVTLIGLDLGALLGGAVITETVFNLQGVGQWAVLSVFQGDLPVVLAVTVVVAIAVTMMNLVVDIVYAYLDPRVRYT
ncbi:MAG TPA: ABC transporter permease [Actinomycetes bacterium]|nr:ABC transporter permease [Actinomycetes bacterium]